MRFRKIQWGSWWWLGELCEVPRCLLWRKQRHHCLHSMFLVSCIFFNKCFYFSCYMTGYPFIVLTVGTMLYSGSLELTYMTPMKIFTYWVTTLHFPAPTSSPWQPLLNSLLIWVWLLYIPQKKKKKHKRIYHLSFFAGYPVIKMKSYSRYTFLCNKCNIQFTLIQIINNLLIRQSWVYWIPLESRATTFAEFWPCLRGRKLGT